MEKGRTGRSTQSVCRTYGALAMRSDEIDGTALFADPEPVTTASAEMFVWTAASAPGIVVCAGGAWMQMEVGVILANSVANAPATKNMAANIARRKSSFFTAASLCHFQV